MGAVTYGGCNYDRLYVLTAQLRFDITQGTVISSAPQYTPPAPGQ